MQPTEPVTNPFRQKIFSLMNQQQPSKILKLSHKIHNKTINTTHSPFKQYSMDTDLAQDGKFSRLDSSSRVHHFKSLQEKLGLKNASNQKSRGKQSSSKSSDKYNRKFISREKKVSFVQNSSKFYYKPSKSKSKSKIKTKNSIKKQFSKSNSSYKIHQHSSPKPKHISKAQSSKSLQKSKKNIKFSQTMTQNHTKKPFESSHHQYQESSDKQTQKKNYLLQTLKKMQSVRKNLTKTFQQYDQEHNSKTERSSDEIRDKKSKQKQKSKSNLTVISDFVNQQSESTTSYGMKKSSSKNQHSKSKERIFQSTKKSSNKNIPTTDIFHKKTPSKNRYIMSQQSFTQKSQKFSHKKPQPQMDKSLLKQVIASCKHPQKWQTILQNELISVLFRVVKRKLIEIQIHAEHVLNSLQIELQKEHIICQSLKEKYQNVRKKQIITLLCSVRGIDCSNCQDLNLFHLPKILVKIQTKLQENTITFRKQVDLPYTWIMLVEKDKKQKVSFSSSKKYSDQSMLNRVKTRSTLQNLQLPKNQKYPNLLEILSFCQIQDNKHQKSVKKQTKKMNTSTSKIISVSSVAKPQEQDKFMYAFELEEHQFKLFVNLNNNQHNVGKNSYKKTTYDIALQGKGQTLMGKIILFLQLLS